MPFSANHINQLIRFILLLFVFLYETQPTVVFSGTYLKTVHGTDLRDTPNSGVDRYTQISSPPTALDAYAVGNCAHCHEMHASIGGGEPNPNGSAPSSFTLFQDNYGASRNELCFTCHDSGLASMTFTGVTSKWGRYEVYQGSTKYKASSHDDSANANWPEGTDNPDPAYDDDGNCNNCHDPHGYADGNGAAADDPIPSMARKRDSTLCTTCHDGSPATTGDISALTDGIPAGHDVTSYTDEHTPTEDPTSYSLGTQKHVECIDCHNPHVAKGVGSGLVNGTSVGEQTNVASEVLQGVKAVNPATGWNDGSNIAANQWETPSAPWSLGFIDSSDVSDPVIKYEWQICFKCHSNYNADLANWDASWTNVAVEFDPDNSGYHSVVQLNPNRNSSTVDSQASDDPVFVAGSGFTKDSTMLCSDCHSQNTALFSSAPAQPVGPHGSSNPSLLIAPYDTGTGGDATSENDLCFRCHDLMAYGKCTDGYNCGGNKGPGRTGFSDVTASVGDKTYNLHQYHVARKTVRCTNCHLAVPHGGKRGPDTENGKLVRGMLLWDADSTPSPYWLPTNWNGKGNTAVRILTWNTSGGWNNKGDCGYNNSTSHNP